MSEADINRWQDTIGEAQLAGLQNEGRQYCERMGHERPGEGAEAFVAGYRLALKHTAASPAKAEVPATLRHDAGAYAQCSYCGRYSLDPRTLSDRPPACECGKRHGWSGSFQSPGPDARWSEAAAPAPDLPAESVRIGEHNGGAYDMRHRAAEVQASASSAKALLNLARPDLLRAAAYLGATNGSPNDEGSIDGAEADRIAAVLRKLAGQP